MEKKLVSSCPAFIDKVSKTVAAAQLLSNMSEANSAENTKILYREKINNTNNTIQIALIGAGGMGVADCNTALTLPGIKLV
jgi:predicted homoserine dehydrogenase-like protein